MSLCAGMAATAADAPLWLRATALSPDGTTIAFTYRGDIYTVPAAGGRARQLTSDPAVDAAPVWSPDGTRIAFRSNRHGGNDIFTVAADGGTPQRITTHSAGESPLTWLNDSTIVFSADIQPSTSDLNGAFFGQTWAVVARPGARPRRLMSLQVNSASAAPDGRLLFENHKSYENLFRKHEQSAGTSDIYMYADGKYTPLVTGATAMRCPVWLGADSFAWLTEDGGTLNVAERPVAGGTPKMLTHFTKHPVRSLSASADGKLLAFSHDGEIYTLRPGDEPRKVAVEIVADDYDADLVKRYVNAGADNLAVSDDADQVAFTLRGDLYVTSTKYKTTRRITDTPGQERTFCFAPDGRTVYYDSERDGLWQIFSSTIVDPAEKTFPYASALKEELVFSADSLPAQQPEVSPDGKKLAFLRDRTELVVLDLDTKKAVTALDGKYNYSYSDGDISFSWSPDSRWLLVDYIGTGGWNNTDIALVAADGSEVVDLTESGYADGNAQWALGGKAITYESGRYGMKSHGSWGNQTDIILMVLDPQAWEEFRMTPEEQALAKKDEESSENSESSESSESSKKSKKAKKNKKKSKEEPVKAIPASEAFDLANRRYRMSRLTPMSGAIGNYYLDAKGDKLYYQAPSAEGRYNLYVRDLRDKGDVKLLASGVNGGFVADKKGENIFVLSGSGISKIALASGDEESVDFEAPYDRRPSLERQYIFDHAAKQVKDKFYAADLNGVDWEGYTEAYRRFLPHISNNVDFAEMLSELLGELNASHTGASAYPTSSPMGTAELGAFFDDTYTGDGLRIARIMPRSPLQLARKGIRPGDIITAVDGQPVRAGADYFPLLEGKGGRKIRLAVERPGRTDTTVLVKALRPGSENSMLYQMWVERNEALVDSLSGGRVGYVHIQGMDNGSFQTVYDRLLGRYRNCEAVVVDTRFNGGGWLHNDVAILLSGREYVRYTPRGRYIGSDPFSQWTKPSVMLVNEANYSDAHGTPYAYKALGIGKLVGAPVPGTMTAVWWEQQIDPTLVFGIPQVTSIDINGKVLENQQLTPDVEVYNTPAETTSGRDAQLSAAVATLLRQLQAK